MLLFSRSNNNFVYSFRCKKSILATKIPTTNKKSYKIIVDYFCKIKQMTHTASNFIMYSRISRTLWHKCNFLKNMNIFLECFGNIFQFIYRYLLQFFKRLMNFCKYDFIIGTIRDLFESATDIYCFSNSKTFYQYDFDILLLK